LLATREQDLSASSNQLAELQSRLNSTDGMLSDVKGQLASANDELAARDANNQSQSAASSQLRDLIESNLIANGVNDPQVSVRDDNSVVVNLRSEALFSSGRARLSSQGRGLMRRVGSALNGLDNAVMVEGHTDSIPVSGDLTAIFPSNWELSVARAANTVNYLESRAGVDAGRLSAIGYGQYRPVAANNTRAGRALNRRVEIVVKP